MNKKIGIYPSDTIAAIATPMGVGGIGIIKVSGPGSLNLVSQIFLPAKKKNIKKSSSHTMHYGWIKDKIKEKIVDEVLVCIMKAPHSYTREDVIEIHSHSGQIVLNRILDLVLSKGIRLADPGEFTRRAFISGRIDLVQAESIADIVDAKSEAHLNVSLLHLRGRLSCKLRQIEKQVEDIAVSLEADISFPEDKTGFPKSKIRKQLNKILGFIDELLSDSDKGKFLREGVRCVICGKSNVGKSSLLNLLLKEERVIVTPVAGTTRDIIEETINIRGLPLKVSDTAGIINPRDLIEEKAVQYSYRKIEQADLVLLVFDGSKKITRQDKSIIDRTRDKNRIFIVNKIDLKQKIQKSLLQEEKGLLVEISVLKEKGLQDLEAAIVNRIWKGFKGLEGEPVLVSNIRHINLLKQTRAVILRMLKNKDYSADFYLFSLEEAKSKIAQIFGAEFSSDILDSVFNNFCIGK